MSDYQTAALALRDSLLPLLSYCERQRQRTDLSEFATRHVLSLEAACEAASEFYEAAEAKLAPPTATAIILRTQRHLAKTAYLLQYPAEYRRSLSDYAQAFALYSHPHLAFPTITSHE